MSDATMQSGGDRGDRGDRGRQRDVTCPRCGYDVSGAFPTWTESCPVEGQCTECGLEFLWRDLLNPDFTAVWWVFDARNRRKRWVRSFVVTSLMLLRPRRLWVRITMWNPPTVWRLAILLFAWLASMYAVGAAAKFAHLEWVDLQWKRGAYPDLILGGGVWLWPLPAVADYFYYDTMRYAGFYLRPPFVFNLAMMLAIPLAFVMLTDSCRIARVRPLHILRGFVYAAIPMSLLIFVTHHIAAYSGLGVDEGLLQIITGVPAAAYLGVFWRAMIRRYLHMPHAYWVFFATYGVGTLASFTLAFSLWVYTGPG